MFKALGRAIAQGAAIDPRLSGSIPSTKGKLGAA
jgi:imidazoleglycerol phosphate dehydratase HisB